jgi:hypothetical protein
MCRLRLILSVCAVDPFFFLVLDHLHIRRFAVPYPFLNIMPTWARVGLYATCAPLFIATSYVANAVHIRLGGLQAATE